MGSNSSPNNVVPWKDLNRYYHFKHTDTTTFYKMSQTPIKSSQLHFANAFCGYSRRWNQHYCCAQFIYDTTESLDLLFSSVWHDSKIKKLQNAITVFDSRRIFFLIFSSPPHRKKRPCDTRIFHTVCASRSFPQEQPWIWRCAERATVLPRHVRTRYSTRI